MGRDDLVASAAYQPEPTAAAAARRFVRDTLQEWLVTGTPADGHGLVDDAVLLTSELVTNAVVHAGTPVEVTCRLAGGAVEVVVSDCHPARLVPEPAENEHSPAERTSGRGLLLPSALASAWGVTYGRTTKAVWFRLGLAAAAGLANGITGNRELARHGGLEGLGDGGALAAALRSAARTRDSAAAHAPGQRGTGHGEAVAGPGDPRYQKLLASTVESARAAVGADAACVLMADEDGDLRLSTATGSIPELGGGTEPGGSPAAAAAAGISLAPVRVPAGAAPSVLTVPFVVDGRVTGLLAAVSAAPRRFNEAETVRLQDVADACGPALQRAWLSDLERIRRGRMGALTEARGLLAGGLAPDEIMDMAGRATVPRLAPWCAVLMPAGEARFRAAYLRHCDPARAGALAWLLDRVCGDAEPDLASWQEPDSGSALRWPLAVSAAEHAPAGSGELAAGTAWCFPLGGPADDRGVFVIGGGVAERLPREVAALAADLACRTGLALAGAQVGTR